VYTIGVAAVVGAASDPADPAGAEVPPPEPLSLPLELHPATASAATSTAPANRVRIRCFLSSKPAGA
jgi:hypothetical protein